MRPCYQYVLDADGNPIEEWDYFAWGRWMEANHDARVVAKTSIGSAEVSTVFLGLDHGFVREGPPILYETMVFGGRLDEECVRYATRAEAVAGHEAICERIMHFGRRRIEI